jgi:hypothetical protein
MDLTHAYGLAAALGDSARVLTQREMVFVYGPD